MIHLLENSHRAQFGTAQCQVPGRFARSCPRVLNCPLLLRKHNQTSAPMVLVLSVPVNDLQRKEVG